MVQPGGAIPQGTGQQSTLPDCTPNAGLVDFDSVKVAAGASVEVARAACQTHFGKNLRYTGTGTPEAQSEIWNGSGFWYCTP